MTTPANRPGFSTDAFSPPTQYRDASIKDIVDTVAGPEPQATLAYPFRDRKFIELQPYGDIEE